MITMDREYTTKDGLQVRIYAVDGADNMIHGAIKFTTGWRMQAWSDFGVAMGKASLCLVEKWTPNDKDPIWCWNNDSTSERRLRFWDAKNYSSFDSNGERDGIAWDHFEKVENIEPWMIEMQKLLKD